MKNEIQHSPPAALDRSSPINIGSMMQVMIDKGITAENVMAMEQLVKLQERMMDRDAEKAFAAAFVAVQSEMPKVQATKAVPGSGNTIRYHFAPFEEIMRQVAPILKRNGFTVSFSTDYQTGPPERLIKTCILQHVEGHIRRNAFAVRVGKGPPSSSEAQGDGAASTYAKRFALCDALNITVVGLDEDARAEGSTETISAELAADLKKRCDALGPQYADVKKLLVWCRAATFEDIPVSKYNELSDSLSVRENRKMLDRKEAKL